MRRVLTRTGASSFAAARCGSDAARRRGAGGALACFLLAAAAAGPVRAQSFSDQAVERAITKGVRFLWSRQRKNGSWEEKDVGGHKPYPVGPTAICAYALLESGVRPTDKRMAKTLGFLAKTRTDKTYDLAFRALAYAAAARRDPNYRDRLRRDVSQLLRSIDRAGGYTYVSRGSSPRRDDYSGFAGAADNSNTQYGLLGVWAGRMHDLEVPYGYWQMSLRYWQRMQQRDGGWGYSPKGRPKSYMAMTLAGLASVFVCYDNLYAMRFLRCQGNASFGAAERGLAWVEKHAGDIEKFSGHYYYTLYGVERVGLATGYKYFGRYDWYKRGASALIRRQEGNGRWKASGGNTGGDNTTTAYALLFLLRGRRPVLFNRLEYDGDWNNRPRALANLTRWFGRAFEGAVHWQIINLRTPVEEWHDAPILCLSGATEPKLSDADLRKLRTFVYQGGSIFSITECAGKGFHDGIRKVYRRLFPRYELKELPRAHELYRAYHELKGDVTFHEISNGARPLVVHTDTDIASPWQAMRYLSAKHAFEAAVNVVAYTNDKLALAGRLRFRGTTLWPKRPGGGTVRTIRVARLRHEGNCDPEPLAYERFARLMARRTGTKVEVLGPVPVSALPGSKAHLAAMTGTEAFRLGDGEKTMLKAWLERGGTLVIDAAGGARAFRESAEALLAELFGRRASRQLAITAPLFHIKGCEIRRAHYRRRTRELLGNPTDPILRVVLLDGRPAVYFSREDITCGLVGYPSYTVYGYEPDTAFALMRNIVFQAWGGDLEPAKPAPKPAPARRGPSASCNGWAAPLAMDGKSSTRWDTGRPMHAGDWFAIDLGRERKVKQVTLDAGASKNDYPRGYKVYVSSDGRNWGKHVLEGRGKQARTVLRFKKPLRCCYVRIVLTARHDRHHWSIHELKVEAE